jgi:hypothetical protein
MTSRGDLDPIVLAWFADGPSSMPDRVIAVVTHRIARQPQRRSWQRRAARSTTRPLTLGAALAATLVVAVAGWSLLPRQGEGHAVPNASPPAGPSATTETNASNEAEPTFGVPISYTLPAGWRVWSESTSMLTIGPGDRSLGVSLFGTAIRSASADCARSVQSEVGRDLDSIVASLRGNPAFSVTGVTQTSVGGRRATAMNIAVSPSWTKTCLNSQGKPAAPFLQNPLGMFIELDANQTIHLALVDISGLDLSPPLNGWTTLAAVIAVDAGRLDAAVAQAQPLIDSIRFGP